MYNTRSGSTILMVVLLSGTLVLFATTVVRSISYVTDLAIKRTEYERRHYAFKGLLNYGITIIKIYASSLADSHEMQEEINLDPWLSCYQGSIIISAHHNQPLSMKVILMQQGKILATHELSIEL